MTGGSDLTASRAKQMADQMNAYDRLLERALDQIAYYAQRGEYEADVGRDPTDRRKSKRLLMELRQRGFKAKFSLSRWINVRWSHTHD